MAGLQKSQKRPAGEKEKHREHGFLRNQVLPVVLLPFDLLQFSSACFLSHPTLSIGFQMKRNTEEKKKFAPENPLPEHTTNE